MALNDVQSLQVEVDSGDAGFFGDLSKLDDSELTELAELDDSDLLENGFMVFDPETKEGDEVQLLFSLRANPKTLKP